jgi:hypothetical protein
MIGEQNNYHWKGGWVMESDFNKVYIQNEYETNEKVSKATRFLLYFELLIGVFCWTGIFDISYSMINSLIVATLIPLLLPTIIVDILHIGKPWVKYLIILCAVIVTGICYVLFTFQVILVFIIPTILGALYFGKRVICFTCVMTVINIAISHYITCFYLQQPWIEPFQGIKMIMLYGAVPRILQYLCCAVIIGMLNNRYTKFIHGFYLLSERNELQKQQKQTDSDNRIPTEYGAIIYSMTERELDVSRLLAKGFTNMQIANELCL